MDTRPYELAVKKLMDYGHSRTTAIAGVKMLIETSTDKTFLEIVKRHISKGLSKAEAIRAAVHENPAAHRAWLATMQKA